MDTTRFLRIVWAHKYIVAACVIIGCIVGVAYTTTAVPMYGTSVRMLITFQGATSQDTPRLSAATIKDMAKADAGISRVLTKYGVSMGPTSFAGSRMRVVATENNQVVLLYVTDTDPKRAADLANGLADELLASIQAYRVEQYKQLAASIEGQLQASDASIKALQGAPGTVLTSADTDALRAAREQRSTLLGSLVIARAGLASGGRAGYVLSAATPGSRTGSYPAYLSLLIGGLLGLALGVALALAVDYTLRVARELRSSDGSAK